MKIPKKSPFLDEKEVDRIYGDLRKKAHKAYADYEAAKESQYEVCKAYIKVFDAYNCDTASDDDVSQAYTQTMVADNVAYLARQRAMRAEAAWNAHSLIHLAALGAAPSPGVLRRYYNKLGSQNAAK